MAERDAQDLKSKKTAIYNELKQNEGIKVLLKTGAQITQIVVNKAQSE